MQKPRNTSMTLKGDKEALEELKAGAGWQGEKHGGAGGVRNMEGLAGRAAARDPPGSASPFMPKLLCMVVSTRSLSSSYTPGRRHRSHPHLPSIPLLPNRRAISMPRSRAHAAQAWQHPCPIEVSPEPGEIHPHYSKQEHKEKPPRTCPETETGRTHTRSGVDAVGASGAAQPLRGDSNRWTPGQREAPFGAAPALGTAGSRAAWVVPPPAGGLWERCLLSRGLHRAGTARRQGPPLPPAEWAVRHPQLGKGLRAPCGAAAGASLEPSAIYRVAKVLVLPPELEPNVKQLAMFCRKLFQRHARENTLLKQLTAGSN